MEEVISELTSDNCLALMKLYNSKQKELTRAKLCSIVGISENNTSSYSRIMRVLESNNICMRKDKVLGYLIIIDGKKLEDYLLKSDVYKLVDSFIHSTGIGWSTP